MTLGLLRDYPLAHEVMPAGTSLAMSCSTWECPLPSLPLPKVYQWLTQGIMMNTRCPQSKSPPTLHLLLREGKGILDFYFQNQWSQVTTRSGPSFASHLNTWLTSNLFLGYLWSHSAIFFACPWEIKIPENRDSGTVPILGELTACKRNVQNPMFPFTASSCSLGIIPSANKCLLSIYFVLDAKDPKVNQRGRVTGPKELHCRETWNETFMGYKLPPLVVHFSVVWEWTWREIHWLVQRKHPLVLTAWVTTGADAHGFLDPITGALVSVPRTNHGYVSCSSDAQHRIGVQQIIYPSHLGSSSHCPMSACTAIPGKQLHSTWTIKTTGSVFILSKARYDCLSSQKEVKKKKTLLNSRDCCS